MFRSSGVRIAFSAVLLFAVVAVLRFRPWESSATKGDHRQTLQVGYEAKRPETKPAAPKKPQVNRYRLHERSYTGSNFGLMRVKWDGPNPSLRLEVCGMESEVVISRDIPFSELRAK